MRSLLLCALLLASCPRARDQGGTAPAPAPETAAGARPDVLSLKRPPQPEWFGIYIVGKKAGFTKSDIRLEDRAGQRVLAVREEAEITVTLGGAAVKRAQRDEKIYEGRPGGRLLEFTSERWGDGGMLNARGTCGEAECVVAVTSAEGKKEQRLPNPGERVEQADAARLAAALGEAVRGPRIQGEPLRVRSMEDLFMGRRKMGGAGVEVEVAVVAEQEVGDRVSVEVAVAGDGRIVETRIGDSLVAKAEPEEVARRLDKVDMFNLTRVALPGPLPRDVPRAISYRLEGMPASFRQNEGRQRFTEEPGGQVLLTVQARQPSAAKPAKDHKRFTSIPAGEEEVLGPGAVSVGTVDSDDPAIRALAAQVAGATQGSYAAARLLSDHVYRRLEKTYGRSHDRASEVLSAGSGDCTEHSLLFVALARAAGIPARLVYGLVYSRYGDSVDALYWHAWAEVRSGEEWIELDPTFGQPVADATHILLGRGARLDAVGLLGSLRVVAVNPKAPMP